MENTPDFAEKDIAMYDLFAIHPISSARIQSASFFYAAPSPCQMLSIPTIHAKQCG